MKVIEKNFNSFASKNMKSTILLFVMLLPAVLSYSQTTYEKAIVMVAHDHRFRTENFDGKNDFTETIAAGITVKTICLTTDIQDWNDGKLVRLESDSAIEANFGYANWSRFFEGRLNTLHRAERARGSNLIIIRKTKDIYRTKRRRMAGLILGTEGVRFLNGSIDNLTQYHQRGLRHIQLYREPIATGAAITQAGVTDFGYALIRECNRLGIALDVTHIQNLNTGTEILTDIIKSSSAPVIFSHQHGKEFGATLNDEQIIAVARSGGGHGIIAFHLIEQFVKPSDVSTLVKIIQHIKNLVGIDHIAIGADYSPTASYRWVLKDYHDFPKLVSALEEAGFTPLEIEKILGKNLLAFYRRCWK